MNNNINLTASMPTANTYTWAGPGGYTATIASVTGNTTIANAQVGASGVYTVTAPINYNGIQCMRQATVQVNVVQTHTVSVAASYYRM